MASEARVSGSMNRARALSSSSLWRVVMMVVIAVVWMQAMNVEAHAHRDARSTAKDNEHLTERERVIQDLVARHDDKVPPNYEDNFPTNVDVQIYIVSVNSISETTMDYSLTIFLRQRWNDSRLVYSPLPGIESLELDSRVMALIWIPDLYFTNEKKADFHDITVPNKLMHIYPGGQVLYSVRISMKLSCDMNLWKYPFDTQRCVMYMESYSYSTDNVIFHWNTIPIESRKGMTLPQFQFVSYNTKDCTKFILDANYTCIMVEFRLVRQYGYYLAQVYIPSMLVVILSWVSFWLDIDSVPARISLGLLTVLTMTTQSASARDNLPRVSYIKAIDIWMAMCLFFVFAALIEFAFVNVNARVERRRQTVHSGRHGQDEEQPKTGKTMSGGRSKQDEEQLKGDVTSGTDNDDEVTSDEKPKPTEYVVATDNGDEGKKTERSRLRFPKFGGFSRRDDEEKSGRKHLFLKISENRQRARTLDKISRVAFPAVFIILNIMYWSIYMLLDD